MEDITDLEAGKAAEHIVCANLILGGYKAYLSDQGLSYDVVVDVPERLVRIQVKGTRKLRSIPQRKEHHAGYLFHIKRTGKKGRHHYTGKEFEVLALVALDILEIAYLPFKNLRSTMIFRSPYVNYTSKVPGRIITDFPFQVALKEVLKGGDK